MKMSVVKAAFVCDVCGKIELVEMIEKPSGGFIPLESENIGESCGEAGLLPKGWGASYCFDHLCPACWDDLQGGN